MSCFCFAVTCLVLISAVPVFSEVQIVNADNIDDTRASTVHLAEHHGYVCEEHTVTTKDKFILKVHRLTGKKNGTRFKKTLLPVFLQHGLLQSSADWIIPGPGKSLGYMLSDKGYDVWMGNSRGNVYSRKHLTLKPDDDKFWNWTFHEMGHLDLPAVIDHMLNATGHEKVYYVGHSMGTTMFYVMCSTRQEYNEKVRVMASLAPVAYLSHMTSSLKYFAWLGKNDMQLASKIFYFWFHHQGYHLGNQPQIKIMRAACEMSQIDKRKCFEWPDFTCGTNPKQFNESLRPMISGHVPAGTSTKTIFHFGEGIASGKFQEYDYGSEENMLRYNKTTPPQYNLSLITAPVSLFYGDNDYCCNIKDVKQLKNELGNLEGMHLVNYKGWSHNDFIWGIDAPRLVYDNVVQLFLRYPSN